MKEVVWGIIGCGDVAEVKSGPAFQNSENSSLLAVMRRDITMAKDFAQRHHVPLYFDDAKDILNHQDINAIYIATPPSTHLEYALAALKAKKDIYLEKPMTLNAAEAEILSKALKSSESKLTVAHYRRQLPAFLKVKGLLQDEVIGKILFTDIQILQTKSPSIVGVSQDNWRLKPTISGGGFFHDLSPHQLDLMLQWFGDVEYASGYSSKENSQAKVANTVNGIIQFKNGVHFRGVWCFNVSEACTKDECIIYGTNGSITFSFYGEEVKLLVKGKENVFNFKSPKHIQQPMIQSTVDYFLGKRNNPCSVDEGLAVMNIIDTFTS